MRVLLDSGCGGSLVNHSFVNKLKQCKNTRTTWTTKAGVFKTEKTVKAKFKLPEFFQNCDIQWKLHVDQSDPKDTAYDMIIGRDILHELGIDLLFSQGVMQWEGATVPMRDPKWLNSKHIEQLEDEIFAMEDPLTTEAERIQSIIDVKYAPQDVDKIVEDCAHLTDKN